MSLSYDVFCEAFLAKVTEYKFLELEYWQRDSLLDGYLKRAIASFKSVCQYDLSAAANDEMRVFDIEIVDEDLDELVDILSEGMLVQWLKPYVYHQENLQAVLNTRDFSTYSPAELLMRIGDAYTKAQRDYTQKIRDYSYTHGDLTALHI